jgi:EAL and modified HD-GYP domain-containing signal transduction protein
MAPLNDLIVSPDVSSQKASREWQMGIGCVARQPILGLHNRIHGYELLFQMDGAAAAEVDELQATRSILDEMVLFGLERLTGGAPAFIKCTAESLTEQLVAVLPPSTTVLEISQCLEMTPKLLVACRKLKERGFRLALVDFTESAAPHPLVDLIEYVKVDLTRTRDCGQLRQWLEGTAVAMVANGIEKQEDYRKARALGFEYFQGYYFCNPEPIRNAKISANRLFHIEILRQLFRDPLELNTLCPLVMRDASLVYRVLRLVNSPFFGVRCTVNSIESAIMILGDTAFRRVATLAIQCALNDGQPPEILHMSLVRARFCSQAACLCGLDSNEQYLLGMLSLLSAMLRIPMDKLAPDLPLRAEIRQALVGSAVKERRLLAWIESREGNKEAESQAIAYTLGADQQKLMKIYVDALVWEGAAPDLFS